MEKNGLFTNYDKFNSLIKKNNPEGIFIRRSHSFTE